MQQEWQTKLFLCRISSEKRSSKKEVIKNPSSIVINSQLCFTLLVWSRIVLSFQYVRMCRVLRIEMKSADLPIESLFQNLKPKMQGLASTFHRIPVHIVKHKSSFWSHGVNLASRSKQRCTKNF